MIIHQQNANSHKQFPALGSKSCTLFAGGLHLGQVRTYGPTFNSTAASKLAWYSPGSNTGNPVYGVHGGARSCTEGVAQREGGLSGWPNPLEGNNFRGEGVCPRLRQWSRRRISSRRHGSPPFGPRRPVGWRDEL